MNQNLRYKLGQSIQVWTNWNLWKTAFKKIWNDVVCKKTIYITSNFLKAVFHKFHLVHFLILCSKLFLLYCVHLFCIWWKKKKPWLKSVTLLFICKNKRFGYLFVHRWFYYSFDFHLTFKADFDLAKWEIISPWNYI